MNAMTIIGIAVAVIGSVIENYGVTLQKTAHKFVKNDEQYFLNPKWLLGMSF